MAQIDGVNMTKRELEQWLKTDESKAVGQSEDGGESTGRKSAKRIVQILDKIDKDFKRRLREDQKHVEPEVDRLLRNEGK